MANTVNTKEEIRKESLAENINSGERFYNEHKKTIWSAAAAAVVVVIAVLAYNKFIYQPACAEALAQSYQAETAFAGGEFQLALEGDENTLGFADICSQFGKKAGSSVLFNAAVCAYRTEQYEDALSYISKYSSKDRTMKARATALKGDCLIALEQTAKGAATLCKAASIDGGIFAAGYLLKAGIAYESLGQNEKALDCYRTIKDGYAMSIEAYDIDRYIERVK